MKKHIPIFITAILFFCFFNVLCAEEWMQFTNGIQKEENSRLLTNLFLIDRIIIKSDYYGTYKYSYEYDSIHMLIKEFRQNFKFEKWLDSIQIFNSYDSIGSLQSVVKRKFENEVWINVHEYLYTYDTLLNQKIRTYKEWILDKWEDKSRVIYKFDNKGNPVNEITQVFENEKWINEYKDIYEHNIFNNIQSEIHQFWQEESWNNITYSNYLYDSTGLLTAMSFMYWRSETSNWYNSSRKLFFYDSNFVLNSIRGDEWSENNMMFLPSWQRKFEYNKNGDKQTEFYDYFTQDFEWEKYSQLSYSYDSDNRLILVNSYKWNDSQWVSGDNSIYFDDYLNKSYWFSANLLEIYWTSVTEVQDMNYDKKLDIRNSPNPFSESTTIHYYLDEPALVSINIYNSFGNKICNAVNEFQDSGEQQFVFDGKNYPSGFYFYTIQIGDRILSGKMVLIK
ncbi:MAG: T9SS type A sorting domain-containing protein [bacterium]